MTIKWKEDYRLGIALIDEQHMKLLALADQAYELLANDLLIDKYDKIVAIIQELKEYSVYHFNCEEQYMASIGYHRLLSQKVDHSDFIDKINQIDLAKVDDNQDEYLSGILDFMVNWIDFHILKKDKLIAASRDENS